jgi:small-conductance mechanosensitive channel
LEQQASASTDVFGETADALSLFNAFGSVFDAFGNDLGAAFPEVFSDLTTFAFDGSSDNTGLVMNSQFVDVTIKSGFGVSFVTAFADSFGSATGVTGIIVPEPGILSLLGIGLVAVGFAGRRRLSAVDA